jgi:hypothetical protein
MLRGCGALFMFRLHHHLPWLIFSSVPFIFLQFLEIDLAYNTDFRSLTIQDLTPRGLHVNYNFAFLHHELFP